MSNSPLVSCPPHANAKHPSRGVHTVQAVATTVRGVASEGPAVPDTHVRGEGRTVGNRVEPPCPPGHPGRNSTTRMGRGEDPVRRVRPPPAPQGVPTPRVRLPSHRPAMAELRQNHRRLPRRRYTHVRRIRNRPSVGQGDRNPPPEKGGVQDPSTRASPRRIGIPGEAHFSFTRFRTVAISAQVNFTLFFHTCASYLPS